MHPYANYPLRFRRFFNNFMMSKTGNDTIDGMNWARDVKLYKIEDVVEKAGLQLPSFSMAKEVFEKYGYAPESSEEEVEKAADEAFRLGYDTGRTVAEEAANHPDIETPEEAYANFEEAYVTSSDYTNFVLPELRRLAKCGDVGSGSFPVCSEESMKRFHVLVDKFWHGVYAGIRDNWQKKKNLSRESEETNDVEKMRITVWKSDYKDFKGLWYASRYFKDHAVKIGKNFIVFEGCNPYEIIKYPYIQKNAEEFSYNDWLSFCKTISDDLTAEEKEQLEKIKERVDNLEIDMARAAQQISDALVYPKGHVVRQEIFTILAGERW